MGTLIQDRHLSPTRSPVRLAVATVCALSVLTACADTDDAADARATQSTQAPSDTAEPTITASPSAEPTALTQEEQWRQNFLDDQKGYRRAVNAAVGSGAPITVITLTALTACSSLVAARALPRRLTQVASGFSEAAALTSSQSLAFIDATVSSVCPDQQSLHESQVAAAVKQARRVARAKAAQARRDARERAEQEQQDAPAPVFYENCTAVEAAGAAPISVGQPGYSRDLDRDGDGVACEQ